MQTKIQSILKYVFTDYYNGSLWGFSNIEPLKLIPSLLSYYGDKNMSDAIKNDGNILRSLLVKIELVERSIIRVQEIPKEFMCIFRNENREPQMPTSFTFSPQIHIPEYPTQAIEKKLFEEIQAELSNIDILGILIYIKEKASETGDFIEAMKN